MRTNRLALLVTGSMLLAGASPAKSIEITIKLTDQDQQVIGQLPLQLTDCLASIASNDGDRKSCQAVRNTVAAIANSTGQAQQGALRARADADAAKARADADAARAKAEAAKPEPAPAPAETKP